jgi:hypothetical protein
MRVIIAGSRSITDYKLVELAVTHSGYKIQCVISGTAHGVDKLGEKWAELHNACILRMPADWMKFGKAAGMIRNGEMAKIADAAVILHDGSSKGTKNMIERMEKLGKPYFLEIVSPTLPANTHMGNTLGL